MPAFALASSLIVHEDPPVPASATAARLGGVLVVSDDPTRREHFREVLGRHGIQTVGVPLTKALAAFRRAPPGALLVDLGSPDEATLRRARGLICHAQVTRENVLGVVESSDPAAAARVRSWGVPRVAGWPAPGVLIALHVEQIVRAQEEPSSGSPSLSVVDGAGGGSTRRSSTARRNLRLLPKE